MIVPFMLASAVAFGSSMLLSLSGKKEEKKENGAGWLFVSGVSIIVFFQLFFLCYNISAVGAPFWLSSQKTYVVLSQTPVEGGIIVNLRDEPSREYYSVLVKQKLPEGTDFVRLDDFTRLKPVKPYSAPTDKPVEVEKTPEKVSEKPEE